MSKSKTDWELPAIMAALACLGVGIAWAFNYGDVGKAQAQAQVRIHWMEHNTQREVSGLKPITWAEFNGEKEK